MPLWSMACVVIFRRHDRSARPASGSALGPARSPAPGLQFTIQALPPASPRAAQFEALLHDLGRPCSGPSWDWSCVRYLHADDLRIQDPEAYGIQPNETHARRWRRPEPVRGDSIALQSSNRVVDERVESAQRRCDPDFLERRACLDEVRLVR